MTRTGSNTQHAVRFSVDGVINLKETTMNINWAKLAAAVVTTVIAVLSEGDRHV